MDKSDLAMQDTEFVDDMIVDGTIVSVQDGGDGGGVVIVVEVKVLVATIGLSVSTFVIDTGVDSVNGYLNLV